MLLKLSLVLTTCLVLSAASDGPEGTGGVMILPVDPDVAVADEYRHLKAQGTKEALELFIARHPDHPLAKEAAQEILLMKSR